VRRVWPMRRRVKSNMERSINNIVSTRREGWCEEATGGESFLIGIIHGLW